jgi:hypothetical protein
VPFAQLNSDHLFRDDLERIDGSCDIDLGWRMLIPEDNYWLALGKSRFDELNAVADLADVARIRVEHVLGSMLCLSAVVTKQSKELELYGPLVGNNQIALLPTIRVRLRRCTLVSGMLQLSLETPKCSAYGIRFRKQAYPWSVSSGSRCSLRMRRVHCFERFGEVVNYLVQRQHRTCPHPVINVPKLHTL